MKKKAALSIHGMKYIFRLCFQLLFQMGIILVAAGTFSIGAQLRTYFIILTSSYIVELVLLASHNPEVLNERIKNIKGGTKSWDKILLSLYVTIAFVFTNIVIGLDIRYGWPHLNFYYIFIGMVLYVLSVIISTNSMLTNKYFESTSRIQKERNQGVVSTGIYSVVRHPGYSSIIVWAVSIPLLTGAIYTVIPSTAIIIIISLRTYLEDKMLKEELPGYQDYTSKVKYRLIPYIW